MISLDPSQDDERKKGKRLNATDHAIAGAVSGCATRFFGQPLDVIKIRFQLQIEPLSKRFANSKYWSILQATGQIVQDEGISALWKGHVPAQLLSITYGTVQFVTFEAMRQEMGNISDMEDYQSTLYFVSGAVAGCLATLVSFPFDVVRTRLVAQGEPKFYKGVTHAFRRIFTKEGPRAFYKGLTPTLLQVGPHAGVQFASYKIFKEIFIEMGGKETVESDDSYECSIEALSFSGTLLCGSLAGVCAKTVVYPLDVARKRLQIQGFEKARVPFGEVFRCTGFWNCMWLIMKHEKWGGLYKGFTPSLLKAGITTAFHFAVYERTCHLLKNVLNR